jgi:hypothetical protein
MISHSIILELINLKVKFSYESYDHEKAVADYENKLMINVSDIKAALLNTKLNAVITTTSTSNTNIPPNLKMLRNQYHPKTCWSLPDEFKQKHLVWRTGKLRAIRFDSRGDIHSFKIGNKFYKTFYMSEFGIKVKPILSRIDDKHNLIGRGLAVELK